MLVYYLSKNQYSLEAVYEFFIRWVFFAIAA